ncbi:MAG: alginate lyase family protein [Asticcacaulis sp.]
MPPPTSFSARGRPGYVRRMDRTKIFGSGPAAKNARSNWQSHRIKLVTLMAVALDDDTLFADARRLFRNQVAANIHRMARSTTFVDRDAVSYVLYDLQPLLQASLAAKTRGEDWYHYESPTGSFRGQGGGIVSSPMRRCEKTHQEFVHSIIAFDAKRADAGETGFSGPFDPATAGTFMWTVSALDPSYLPLAQSLKDVGARPSSRCAATKGLLPRCRGYDTFAVMPSASDG